MSASRHLVSKTGVVLYMCLMCQTSNTAIASSLSRVKRDSTSSHDDAYNAIISQYYVTDPFFQSKRYTFTNRPIKFNFPITTLIATWSVIVLGSIFLLSRRVSFHLTLSFHMTKLHWNDSVMWNDTLCNSRKWTLTCGRQSFGQNMEVS